MMIKFLMWLDGLWRVLLCLSPVGFYIYALIRWNHATLWTVGGIIFVGTFGYLPYSIGKHYYNKRNFPGES